MSNFMDKAKDLLNSGNSNSGSTDTSGTGTDASQAPQTGGTSSFDTSTY